jgi:hypothetical protein
MFDTTREVLMDLLRSALRLPALRVLAARRGAL